MGPDSLKPRKNENEAQKKARRDIVNAVQRRATQVCRSGLDAMLLCPATRGTSTGGSSNSLALSFSLSREPTNLLTLSTLALSRPMRKAKKERTTRESPHHDPALVDHDKEGARETQLRTQTTQPNRDKDGTTQPRTGHSLRYTWHRHLQTPQPHPTRMKMTTQYAPAQSSNPPTPLQVERVVLGDEPAPTGGGAGHR